MAGWREDSGSARHADLGKSEPHEVPHYRGFQGSVPQGFHGTWARSERRAIWRSQGTLPSKKETGEELVEDVISAAYSQN